MFIGYCHMQSMYSDRLGFLIIAVLAGNKIINQNVETGFIIISTYCIYCLLLLTMLCNTFPLFGRNFSAKTPKNCRFLYPSQDSLDFRSV